MSEKQVSPDTPLQAIRIGLVSDTHVPVAIRQLPEELTRQLDGVDRIFHSGDLVRLDVIETLESIAPTIAVAGNMDPPVVTSKLATHEIIEIGDFRIGLQHGHQRHALQDRYIGKSYDSPEFDSFYRLMAAQLPDCGIIVFGHFHAPLVKHWNDILFINPGAIAMPCKRPTFAILTLGGTAGVEIRGL